MADFCKQCSIQYLGSDFGDLAGIADPGMLSSQLCEGCGYTWVDENGVCCSDCMQRHSLQEKKDNE